MSYLDSRRHISPQFDEEMSQIRDQVFTMGGLVEQQLSDGLKALADRDAELGKLVNGRDRQINELEVTIDEACTQFIAKRQPAASDLRLLMTIIKTINDLERIGDEAERIGRMAVKVTKAEGTSYRIFSSVGNMGKQVQRMLHEALDAFARVDVNSAVEVWRSDTIVDANYESLLRELMTYMMEDPRSIPWVLDVMWSARSLERIGDRVGNICEYVIYLGKGKDVRHTRIDEVEAG